MYKFHFSEADTWTAIDTRRQEYAYQGSRILDSLRDIPSLQIARKKLGLFEQASRE